MAKYFSYLLVITLLISTNLLAQDNEKSYFNFGEVLGDDKMLDFMSKSNVRPKAAHMWSNGLSGTYRTSNQESYEEFISNARINSVDFFTSAVSSNEQFVRKFLEDHTQEEILNNQNVQTSARSLVSINRQLKKALEEAESGGAIIYGLEIEGNTSQLDLLSNDSIVKNETRFEAKGEKRFERPQHLKNIQIDMQASSASALEILQQLQSISLN